ncbi:hypothetical protein ABZS77_29285 [Micromonospora sp. NPDC005298]
MARHIAGVWALSTSGRHNVTVATGPSQDSRTPVASAVTGRPGARRW